MNTYDESVVLCRRQKTTEQDHDWPDCFTMENHIKSISSHLISMAYHVKGRAQGTM